MSRLKFHSKDPNKLGRGKGFYYNRTWDKAGFSANYQSKYNADLDHSKGGKTGGNKDYAHTTDNPKKAGTEISAKLRPYLSETGKMYGGNMGNKVIYADKKGKKVYTAKEYKKYVAENKAKTKKTENKYTVKKTKTTKSKYGKKK